MKTKTKQGFLIAFGEIFLKSKGVKKQMKKKLRFNLKDLLEKQGVDFKIRDFRGRLFLETKDFEKSRKILKNLFGSVWFAQSTLLKSKKLKDLGNFVEKNWQDWVKKNQTFGLKVNTGSSDLSREDIIEEAASYIKREVDLDNPDSPVFIEVRDPGFLIYFKKEDSIGGLPVSSQQKVLSLVSGGIDSPVASFLSLKRGAENIWVHFHSFPLVSKKSIQKVKEMAGVFTKRYQSKIKLLLVPFAQIQKKIKIKIPSKYRVLFYRRMMLKISEELAKQNNCKALITGESIGQVSSQTISNMEITQKGTDIPILQPLITEDKQEIVNLAKRIGTYEISTKPQEDCCTLFISDGQTASGDLKKALKLEDKLSLDELIEEALEEKEIIEVK